MNSFCRSIMWPRRMCQPQIWTYAIKCAVCYELCATFTLFFITTITSNRLSVLRHSPKNRCTVQIIMCKIMQSALQLNLFSFLSFTLFYPVFMVWWYGARLSRVCGVLAWSYAALCPAFHWLLSKHTQRWKPFLLAHTVKEALFCWRAAETQRTEPSGWSLCLLCAQIWQWNIKHINWPWVDHLTRHENWNFLTAKKAVCKLLENTQ